MNTVKNDFVRKHALKLCALMLAQIVTAEAQVLNGAGGVVGGAGGALSGGSRGADSAFGGAFGGGLRGAGTFESNGIAAPRPSTRRIGNTAGRAREGLDDVQGQTRAHVDAAQSTSARVNRSARSRAHAAQTAAPSDTPSTASPAATDGSLLSGAMSNSVSAAAASASRSRSQSAAASSESDHAAGASLPPYDVASEASGHASGNADARASRSGVEADSSVNAAGSARVQRKERE